MKKTRKAYEEYLNDSFSPNYTRRHTEHCWAGDDKTPAQKRSALRLANKGLYGTILRKHDPIAFEVGYQEWSLKNN